MKRLLALFVMTMLLVGLLSAPVVAAPDPGLTALARYFPDTTPAFVVLRTSEAQIDTLDALFQRFSEQIPEMAESGLGLRELLDLAALTSVESNFQTGIRPWLGDSIAAGVLSIEGLTDMENPDPDDIPFVIAVSITDREAAQPFVDNLVERILPADDFELRSEGNFTLYVPQVTENYLLLGDDVLMLGNRAGITTVTDGIDSNLSDNSQFNNTIALLPADDYTLAVYIDTESITGAMLSAAASELPPAFFEFFDPALLGAYPSVAMGLIVLENRAITLDIAEAAGDLSGVMEAGLPYFKPLPPVDPGFAAHIPADALFSLHGSDLKAVTALVGQLVRQSIEQVANLAALGEGFGGGDLPFDLSQFRGDIDETLAEANEQFTTMTGLDIQDDILGWMTGDYAIFFSLNLSALANNGLPVEIGVVIAATDPAAARNVVDSLTTLAEDQIPIPDVVSQEDVAGTTVTVLDLSELGPDAAPVEVLMGSNDAVFALGTRGAVQAIITPVNGGLAATPAYIDALNFVVENPTTIWYLNPDVLEPLLGMAAGGQDTRQAQTALKLISSLTLSGTTFEDGSSILRFVLALAE